MIDWKLREVGYDVDDASHLGNKFLNGNGYMGVRGTLDEYDSDKLVAINLAGIYDQVGDAWREPLNAPNGFYGYLQVGDEVLKLPEVDPTEHELCLDYKHGVLCRKTVWNTSKGKIVYETKRFVSMKDVHLGAELISVYADYDTEIVVTTGIDGNVWDINGPHYDEIKVSSNEDIAALGGITHEKKYSVTEAFAVSYDFDANCKEAYDDNKALKAISFDAKANVTYQISKFFAIYTSKDVIGGYDECLKASQDEVLKATEKGFDKVLLEQKERWEDLWKYSAVEIDGDDMAMEALNYSLYHLHCIAPRHTDSLSIAARGLSGQTYKGAVFWDTEMFILDFFLMTEPAVAKKLMKYRIDTLDGAKAKAKGYGFDGAFYAWESQEGGFDACSDYNVTDVFTGRPMRTYFKDKQIHISAAVVYGIGRYVDLTGDMSILSEGGAKTILECAKFYYDLLLTKVGSDKYELHDVIGPDEYHERVNNNGYTNRMAKYTFDEAVKVIDRVESLEDTAVYELATGYDLADLREKFVDASEKIYIPGPNEDGIIPQFDGYFDLEDATLDEVRSRVLDPKEYWGGANGVAAHTQIIKQADVITWLNLFPQDTDDETKIKNWEYYEPRTEHGSSLSACMYSMLACRCKKEDKAYPFFIKSATADLTKGGKEWAGLVYIGGTHPASEGGAYMVAIKGFAGLSIENDVVSVSPNLPEGWKSMKFYITYKNKVHKIEICGRNAEITVVK